MKKLLKILILLFTTSLHAMEQRQSATIQGASAPVMPQFAQHPNFKIEPGAKAKQLIQQVYSHGGLKEFRETFLEKTGATSTDYLFTKDPIVRLHSVVYHLERDKNAFASILTKHDELTALLCLSGIDTFILDEILRVVVKQDEINILKWLHKCGANIFIKDCDNKTLLFDACIYLSQYCLEYLLEQGVDPLCKESNHWQTITARDSFQFMPFANRARVECIKALLEAAEKRHAPLRAAKILTIKTAVLNGDCAKIKEIFEQDREFIDEKDEFGLTALMHAVQIGSLAIVKLLVHYGTYLFTENNEKRTALQIAHANEQKEIAEFLRPFVQERSQPYPDW